MNLPEVYKWSTLKIFLEYVSFTSQGQTPQQTNMINDECAGYRKWSLSDQSIITLCSEHRLTDTDQKWDFYESITTNRVRGLRNKLWMTTQLALTTKGCLCASGDRSHIWYHGYKCIFATAESPLQFGLRRGWLGEEGRCDSAYGLSVWLMTSSTAAGWRWAVGWVPWQPASNPVARASAPGMCLKTLGYKLKDLPPPHQDNTPACICLPVSFSLRGSVLKRVKVMEMLRKYPRNSQWGRSLTCLALNGTWCMKAHRESPPLVINLKLPLWWTDLPALHEGRFCLTLKISQLCIETSSEQYIGWFYEIMQTNYQ